MRDRHRQIDHDVYVRVAQQFFNDENFRDVELFGARLGPLHQQIGAGGDFENLERAAAFDVCREDVAAADDPDFNFCFHGQPLSDQIAVALFDRLHHVGRAAIQFDDQPLRGFVRRR